MSYFPIRELDIQKEAETPTIEMLGLWNSLSKSTFDHPIEVIIRDSIENKMIQVGREMDFATFENVDGLLVLCLWLVEPTIQNTISITHELGHWILQLQDFTNYIYTQNPSLSTQAILVSMCHHPPLYELQMRYSVDPQPDIDRRAIENLSLLQRKKLPLLSNYVDNALLISDDVINCTNRISRELKKRTKRFFPEIHVIIERILEVKMNYDLLAPQNNLEFQSLMMSELGLGKDWEISDDVQRIVEEINARAA